MPAGKTDSLFESPRTWGCLDIADADIRFIHDFYGTARSRVYFDRLREETCWTQPIVRVWGKDHVQPRLSCWVGDMNAVYRFSGKTFSPWPWTATLQEIRSEVETAIGFRFNSVLLNFYRNGADSIGMHSDNEPELGARPVIASLSLGAERVFRLKHRQNAATPVSITLPNGILMVMAGRTQECWLHGVSKEGRDPGPRINLTFRHIFTS
ncbi:MAG: alpha-ketoglutarate-dependent dioxygenase AlkB family protein [Burkholderiaceae bacterium]